MEGFWDSEVLELRDLGFPCLGGAQGLRAGGFRKDKQRSGRQHTSDLLLPSSLRCGASCPDFGRTLNPKATDCGRFFCSGTDSTGATP